MDRSKRKSWLEAVLRVARIFLLVCLMMGCAFYSTVWWLGGVTRMMTTGTIAPTFLVLLAIQAFVLSMLYRRKWFDALLEVGYAVPVWVRFSSIAATICLYALNSAIWTDIIVKSWFAMVRIADDGIFKTLVSDHSGKLLLAVAMIFLLVVSRAGQSKATD